MRAFFNEQGEGIPSVIVGAIVLSLIAAVLASAVGSAVAFGTKQATRQASDLSADSFLYRVGPEAKSGTAIFIPTHDVFGRPNSIENTPTAGGVVGDPGATAAHEFDVFQRGLNILGIGAHDSWWAYVYDATAHTVSRYAYSTRDASGIAQGVNGPSATITNVRAFNASYLPASNLPQVERTIAATGVAVPDVLIPAGFPEVYEGNRGIVLWLDTTPAQSQTTNPKLRHYVFLHTDAAPQAPHVNYTWAPPASTALVATPSSISYASNGAGGWLPGNPSNTISVYEGYYHRGFSVTPCVSGGTTIATLTGPFSKHLGADNEPNSPPSQFPGEWEQYNVSPAAAGTCTATFSSITTGAYPDNKSATVTITVATPVVPTGPLRTLSQVQFAPGVVADAGSPIRLAEWINKLLGGGVASAGGTSCTYAQLWMYDANGNNVLDTNGADGFNGTDNNGCLSSGPVKLWASEQNYGGSYFDDFSSCRTYVTISNLSWSGSSYATVTPVSATGGCQFPVYSSDKTIANGGSKLVNVIVAPPAGVSFSASAVDDICPTFNSITLATSCGLKNCPTRAGLGVTCAVAQFTLSQAPTSAATGISYTFTETISASQGAAYNGSKNWPMFAIEFPNGQYVSWALPGCSPSGSSCSESGIFTDTSVNAQSGVYHVLLVESDSDSCPGGTTTTDVNTGATIVQGCDVKLDIGQKVSGPYLSP